MQKVVERWQGQTAHQKLRRGMLLGAAVLLVIILIFGWFAAGAVRKKQIFTWGSLSVSFTGEGFTGSALSGELSECAPVVNIQPGSEACYLFFELGSTPGQQWGHLENGKFVAGPLAGWSKLDETGEREIYYQAVDAVGSGESAVRVQLFDRVQGASQSGNVPFVAYAIQSRSLATPQQAWQALRA